MTLEKALRQCLDALRWCSGSPDFYVGGQAREGWIKGPQVAIADAELALAQARAALASDAKEQGEWVHSSALFPVNLKASEPVGASGVWSKVIKKLTVLSDPITIQKVLPSCEQPIFVAGIFEQLILWAKEQQASQPPVLYEELWTLKHLVEDFDVSLQTFWHDLPENMIVRVSVRKVG